jgi:hypothetical protein
MPTLTEPPEHRGGASRWPAFLPVADAAVSGGETFRRFAPEPSKLAIPTWPGERPGWVDSGRRSNGQFRRYGGRWSKGEIGSGADLKTFIHTDGVYRAECYDRHRFAVI